VVHDHAAQDQKADSRRGRTLLTCKDLSAALLLTTFTGFHFNFIGKRGNGSLNLGFDVEQVFPISGSDPTL
jgi:hypothetical protein